MPDSNELYAYFTVTNSFDPDDITKRLGLQPTKAWRKGDVYLTSHLELQCSGWSLYSRIERTADLEDHVRDVISQMDVNSMAFQSVSREFGGCMQLVGYFYVQYPGLQFDAAMVNDLARYSLKVDFDFYYLYSDRREGT